MPATGIEPVWEYKSRRILSPVRLPVPPHRLNGRRRIRTFEGIASRFTVCPLWPLGNPPILYIYADYLRIFLLEQDNLQSRQSESNQQPADYKSAALPLSHVGIKTGLKIY